MKYFNFNSSLDNRQMRKISTIIFLTIVLFLFSGFLSTMRAQDFWQNQLKEARTSFEQEKSLLSRYRLAISRANTGDLWETHDMIDEFADEFDLEELEEEIAFELRLAELGSDNLLYLNYAAFYHSIKENYEKSVDFFTDIISIDRNNIWPYNYKAVILIEELEDYERALKVLNRALNIEDNEYTYLLRGLAHYRLGNYLRAANDIRQGRGTLEEIQERL